VRQLWINDTGHETANRHGIINTTPEPTGLVEQNESDRMEHSDEDMDGTALSTAWMDGIKQTADEEHDRTMRQENQMWGGKRRRWTGTDRTH